MFRTSSCRDDGDCLLDDSVNRDLQDPPDESSGPGSDHGGGILQSDSVHSGNCTATGKGDGGSGTFPTRQRSQGNEVHAVSTYPLGTVRSPEHVTLNSPLDHLQQGDADDSLPADCLLTDDDKAIETESHSNEKPQFVPKPPDDSAVPRRNSCSRRGSLHRRPDSGLSQHCQSKTSNESDVVSQQMSATNSVPVVDSSSAKTATNQSSVSRNNQVHSQDSQPSNCSRKAYRATQCSSLSNPEDLLVFSDHLPTQSERRSSSVNGVTRQPRDHDLKGTVSVTNKPATGRRNRSVDHNSPLHAEDDSLRKHCNKTDTTKATLKISSSRIPLLKHNDDTAHQTKMPSAHRR